MRLVVLMIASMLLLGCTAAVTPRTSPSSQPTWGATERPASTPAPIESAAVGSGATFRLDCGPLEQGRCEQSAAELVKRMAERSPTKTVLSIEYTTPCGSYQLQFDDGSGVGAAVDCIFPSPSGSG